MANVALLEADQQELLNQLERAEAEEREKRQMVTRVQEACKQVEELEIQRKIITSKMRKIMAKSGASVALNYYGILVGVYLLL